MIIRLWHGRTSAKNYEAYTKFMVETAVPDYKSIEGNLACYFTRSLKENEGHFLLITHWQSINAVKAFAGANPEIAKYYPEDDEFLLEKEKHCELYEVFHQSAE